MQHSVNEVLTPWTAPRILQIMEAASASTGSGGGSGGIPRAGTSGDGAADMEGLIKLANHLPDVAGRAMAAPLFTQRPLIDSSSNALAPVLTYTEAHRMCTAALAARKSSWHPDDEARVSRGAQAGDSLAPSESLTAAAELEEVGFAAEFAEPCLRGSFPDVAAALRHVFGDAAERPSRGADATLHGSYAGDGDVLQDALCALLEPPRVSPATEPASPATPLAASRASAPPSSTLRLQLRQPAAPTPSVAAGSVVWDHPLPSAKAVPIEAHCPPGHKAFDQSCVAHTFASDEVAELHAALAARPAPLQVFTAAELKARRQQQQPYGATQGAAAEPASRKLAVEAGAPLHPSPRNRPINTRDVDEGWSGSSGWSSRSRSPASRDGEESAKGEDGGDEERRPTSRDAAADAPEVASGEPEVTARSDATCSSAPAPPRTWVHDDDGDLVLENGRVIVRKRRTRHTKPLPPPLPLPAVLRGSVINPSYRLVLNSAVASAEHPAPQHASLEEPEDGTSTKQRSTDQKRDRDGTAASSASPISPTGNAPRKRMKPEAKEPKRGRKSGAEQEASTTVSGPISTRHVARLSAEEMRGFIGGLRVSDSLRRALLVGVAVESITETSSAASRDEERSETEADEKAPAGSQ